MPIFARSLAIVLLFAAAPAMAASEDDYLALNKSVVAGHVLPRMKAFADAAAGLPPAAERLVRRAARRT